MPKSLEAKLKRQYGAKSPTVWKILNSIGAMRGSKVTAKGRRMEAKRSRGHGSKGGSASHSATRHAAKMRALESI